MILLRRAADPRKKNIVFAWFWGWVKEKVGGSSLYIALCHPLFGVKKLKRLPKTGTAVVWMTARKPTNRATAVVWMKAEKPTKHTI